MTPHWNSNFGPNLDRLRERVLEISKWTLKLCHMILDDLQKRMSSSLIS
jgi:hypothetical protein